jgi:DNA-binding winged helix-turn-helix (wHTH) protein/predicted ATPase
MAEPHSWHFTPFRLDLEAERLWHGAEVVRLTAKAWAVLRCLVAHAGQLVTKEALFTEVWGTAHVSDAALVVCIREIRQALGDVARTPQYVETVRGRGYRFVAPTTAAPVVPASLGTGQRLASVTGQAALLVEREAELVQLQQYWVQALQGVRQVVLITGEAGIGKTALVDAWVAQIMAMDDVWMGRGQCIEQYGAGEAYLPLFEILGQIGQGTSGMRVAEVFTQYAPNWLLQMPGLLQAGAFEAVQQRASGATRERMLRELAEVVEALTEVQPLLLVLEDLHWSDISTLDWLAYIAQRRQTARLLVLGTYRPTDALVQGHPVHAVTQDLLRHGQGVEVGLGYLSVAGIAAYLAQRFGAMTATEGLALSLHQRTDGNPFFLVTVVDELVQREVLRLGTTGWELGGDLEAAAGAVPVSIQQGIMQQVERCAPEVQAVLEAASVAGGEFAAAAVAAGMAQEVDTVEAHCDTCVRHGQFLQALAPTDWPDGTVTARYRFRHALYREVLYARVPVSRRVRWHQQIGIRMEAGYGPQAREIAVELAEHFVRGRDLWRAVRYLQYAGEQAMQRSTHQEALQHFRRGLALLATLPETPARAQQEIDMQLALGPALMAAKGWAVPEVEQTYARAWTLCTQVGETPQLFPALLGLSRFYLTRGRLQTARELGQQMYRLAQQEGTLLHRLEAHAALGDTLFFLGEFAAARTYFDQGIALFDPTAERAETTRRNAAPGVRCLAIAANTLWCLGVPSQAIQRGDEALAQAQALAHPQSLAMTYHFLAFLHYHRREVLAVQAQAQALLTLATAQALPLWIGHGTCWHGWALAMQGQKDTGMAQLRQGLAMVLGTGQTLTQPLHLLLLAETAGYAGQVEMGLDLFAEALSACAVSGRADMLAEAYRLQGVLLQQMTTDAAQAEACFHQALTIARQQQARAWELRAAMSLSQLWQRQGRGEQAHVLLAEIYGWFTEGFETPDLQAAAGLLHTLAGL